MKKFKVYFDIKKTGPGYVYSAVTECGYSLGHAYLAVNEDNICKFLSDFKARLDDPSAPALLVTDRLSVMYTASMQSRLSTLNITLAAPKQQTHNIIEHLFAKFKQLQPKTVRCAYAD